MDDQIVNANALTNIIEQPIPNNEESDISFSSSSSEFVLPQNFDEEDEERGNPEERFRSHNEKKLAAVEINEDKDIRIKRFGLSEEEIAKLEMKKAGTIVNFIENSIIIKPFANDNVLDLDNIIFTGEREIIGKIDDVFGNVESPFYQIQNDTYVKNLSKEEKVKKNDEIFVGGSCKIILKAKIEQLKNLKGCDASNKFDEEVDAKEMEFSDDEQEMGRKGKKKKEMPRSNKNMIKENKLKEKNEMKRERGELIIRQNRNNNFGNSQNNNNNNNPGYANFYNRNGQDNYYYNNDNGYFNQPNYYAPPPLPPLNQNFPYYDPNLYPQNNMMSYTMPQFAPNPMQNNNGMQPPFWNNKNNNNNNNRWNSYS